METYQYALTTLKLFFSRTSSLNQSNLAQTIIWERTSSSLNEWSCLFFRGDNNDNLKMNWELLKIFRTTKPNSTSLDTEHHLVEKDSSMFKWRATYFFLQGEVELKWKFLSNFCKSIFEPSGQFSTRPSTCGWRRNMFIQMTRYALFHGEVIATLSKSICILKI